MCSFVRQIEKDIKLTSTNMNLLNKAYLIVLMILLIPSATYAQNFQGKAYYFSKTSVDMDGWGGRKTVSYTHLTLPTSDLV